MNLALSSAARSVGSPPGLPGVHAMGTGMAMLREEGVDVDGMLAALGRLVDVRQPGWWASELGLRTLQCGARMLVDSTGDERIGLRLGARTPFGAFGIVDYLCGSAGTLREVVTEMMALAPLANEPMRWELTEHEAYAVLALRARDTEALHPVFVDFRLAHLHSVARRLLREPQVTASEVHFPYAASPLGSLAYRICFGEARLRFSAEAAALWFPRALLDRPLPGADPVLHAMLLNHARVLAEGASRPPSCADRLRALVAASPSDAKLGIEEAASQLGTTVRTLRRWLSDDGQNFQAIVYEVRATTAKAYLSDPARSLEEIAARMGFDSALVFRRAFRRWTGEPLSAWRNPM